MTDFFNMTKSEIAAMLKQPLTASAVKKIRKEDLIRHVTDEKAAWFAGQNWTLTDITSTALGHQVEEVMLIDHFEPAWNTRKGGRPGG